MPNFYHSFLFITVWKIKVRFQNREMCFPPILRYNNSSC